MKTAAYITLATHKKYLQGAYNLYKSYLKTNSKYPFYCMVWKETDTSDFKDLPIIIVSKIFKILPKNSMAPGPGVFSKICVWELTQFNYCCYLDSDSIFLHNADNVIDEYIKKYDNNYTCVELTNKPNIYNSFINGQWFITQPNLNNFFKAMKYLKISKQDEQLMSLLCISNDLKFTFNNEIPKYVQHIENINNKKYWEV